MRTLFLLSLFLFLPYAHAQEMDELRKQLYTYIDTLDATVGVAVITAESDTLTINNNIRYPMMSVFKFHQALAVSDYLAGKHLPLETKIEIKPEDLRLKETWSPLRDKYPNGGIELTVADLMTYTMEQSDNLACDILFDRFMSPKAVNAFIKKQGIDNVSIQYNETAMSIDHDLCYDNWSTPYSAALLVDRFIDKKIVDGPYFTFIRDLMLGCATGTNRLVQPFKDQAHQLGHKTGSGYVNNKGEIIACNDIGFVLSANGEKKYVIAVFVRESSLPENATEKIIATISGMVKTALLK